MLLPIEVVVPGLARIVEDRLVRVVLGGLPDDLLQRHRLVGRAGDQLVQLVDIGLVMLAVVEGDGARRDHRLQRVLRIGQGGKREFSFGIQRHDAYSTLPRELWAQRDGGEDVPAACATRRDHDVKRAVLVSAED
jgi:hypothetical protein